MERELRQFEIVGPRPELKDRIRAAAAELGVAPAKPEAPENAEPSKVVQIPRLQTWISSAAALVALGFGIALYMETQLAVNNVIVDESAEPQPPYTLVDQVLVGESNDGVFITEDGKPMMQYRQELLNREEWHDPETGEKRQELTPEQRILIVPVRHD